MAHRMGMGEWPCMDIHAKCRRTNRESDFQVNGQHPRAGNVQQNPGTMKYSISLNRTFWFLIIGASLLITTHRLPAPISEIPQTTPVPKPILTQKPKPKAVESEPKTQVH